MKTLVAKLIVAAVLLGTGEIVRRWAQIEGQIAAAEEDLAVLALDAADAGYKAIEERMAAGEDVVLEIDWQGALQIKQLFPNAVLIFILPPSYDELRQRLRRRGEDHPEVIEQRMVNAREEVAQARHFDYIVVNALFETALFDLKAIVHAQRLKYAAQRRNRSAVFQALDLP